MAKPALRTVTPARHTVASMRKPRVAKRDGPCTDAPYADDQLSSMTPAALMASGPRLLTTVWRLQQEGDRLRFNVQEAESERDKARAAVASAKRTIASTRRIAGTLALALCKSADHVRLTAEEYLAIETALGYAGIDLLGVLNTEPGQARVEPEPAVLAEVDRCKRCDHIRALHDQADVSHPFEPSEPAAQELAP